MNKRLISRLEECGISTDDIITEIVDIHKCKAVIIYTSHLEGLGTKDSDFDIYVLCTDTPHIGMGRLYQNYSVQIKVIKNTSLDIEYWSLEGIDNLINKINTEKSNNIENTEELKLLHRLRVGEVIYDNDTALNIKQKIERSKVKEHITNFFRIKANAMFEDALNMLNSNELECALVTARDALEFAIGTYNSTYGKPNLNPKWIPKIFISLHGSENELVRKYLSLQVYSSVNESNIHNSIENILEFTQDILSDSCMKGEL